MPYKVKRNDLEPPYQVRLTLGTQPIDLSTATSVTFLMTPRGRSTPKVEAPAVILQVGSTDVGWVEYDWAAGDTNTAGIYDVEFRITWPMSRPQTVPNDEYLTIFVLGDLDAGGAPPDPDAPSDADDMAVGNPIGGATPNTLLAVDGSGQLESGPLTASLVSGSQTGGAVPWVAATLIPQNLIVSNAGSLYLCNATHTSASTFGADASNFTALGGGGVSSLNKQTGAVTLASRPISEGGFRRYQSTAILDLSGSSLSAENPRGFWEAGTHYITYDRSAATGTIGVESQADIGLATGAALTSLTDQGILISHTAVSGALPVLNSGGIVNDGGGTYHMFVSAVDAFSGAAPTQGGIYHFTASAPTGPWTLVAGGPVIPSVGGDIPTDVSHPVFYNGAWCLPFMSYAAGAPNTRHVEIATAATLAGPWTRQGSMTTFPNAGGLAAIDSPCLYVDGSRLLLQTTSLIYSNRMWIVRPDLQNADILQYIVSRTVNGNAIEGGNTGWGAGNIYPAGLDVCSVWNAIQAPTAGAFCKVFGGQWVAGTPYIVRQSQAYDSFQAPGVITLPAIYDPASIIAVDLAIAPEETGAFTNGEWVRVETRDATGGLQVFLPGTGFGYGRGRLDISTLDAVPLLTSTKGAGAASPMHTWTFCGYWRLP